MFTNFPFFPEQASAQAAQVDGLYFFMVAVTAFFSLLIATVLVITAIYHRRRHEDEVGVQIHGSPNDVKASLPVHALPYTWATDAAPFRSAT